MVLALGAPSRWVTIDFAPGLRRFHPVEAKPRYNRAEIAARLFDTAAVGRRETVARYLQKRAALAPERDQLQSEFITEYQAELSNKLIALFARVREFERKRAAQLGNPPSGVAVLEPIDVAWSGRGGQRFVENDISFVVLPDLTDHHLEKIGIASLGHRLQLLRAIAELANPEKPPKPEIATAPFAPPQDTAERRQVTVMFSDLVGSTALAARMDPEDLREVFSAYQKCVAEAVQRFGGFVAKYMGDGVLVDSGYPQAHEDDAEQAVRAGLELVRAVSGACPRSRSPRHGL